MHIIWLDDFHEKKEVPLLWGTPRIQDLSIGKPIVLGYPPFWGTLGAHGHPSGFLTSRRSWHQLLRIPCRWRFPF